MNIKEGDRVSEVTTNGSIDGLDTDAGSFGEGDVFTREDLQATSMAMPPGFKREVQHAARDIKLARAAEMAANAAKTLADI